MVKNPPAMPETWVQFLGLEDPLEKGMATHSGILAWRIPWTEGPGRLQSTGSQRVRHDLATKPPPPTVSPLSLCGNSFLQRQWASALSLVIGHHDLGTRIQHSHCHSLTSISDQETEILLHVAEYYGQP